MVWNEKSESQVNPDSRFNIINSFLIALLFKHQA